MFSFLQKHREVEIVSPVNGTVRGIEEVNDPVFSEKMMGDGIAVEYADGDVYAPVSGEITTVIQPSCHAFGLKTEAGLELLVHVGLDTVRLKGGEFKLLKEQGDCVKAGEKILTVNAQALREKGIDMITPIVIVNSDEYEIAEKGAPGGTAVSGKTVLLSCVKKQES